MLDLQLVLDVGCLISPLLEPVSGFVGFAVSSGEFFCPVWLWITAHSFLGDVGFCTILDCFGEGDCSIFGVIYWVGVFPSCEVFPWVSTILAPVSVFEIPTLLNNIDLGVLDVYWKVIRWQVGQFQNLVFQMGIIVEALAWTICLIHFIFSFCHIQNFKTKFLIYGVTRFVLRWIPHFLLRSWKFLFFHVTLHILWYIKSILRIIAYSNR